MVFQERYPEYSRRMPSSFLHTCSSWRLGWWSIKSVENLKDKSLAVLNSSYVTVSPVSPNGRSSTFFRGRDFFCHSNRPLDITIMHKKEVCPKTARAHWYVGIYISMNPTPIAASMFIYNLSPACWKQALMIWVFCRSRLTACRIFWRSSFRSLQQRFFSSTFLR